MTTKSKKAESKKVKKLWHPFWQGVVWSLVVSSIITVFGTLGASLALFSPFSEEITSFMTEKKEKIAKVVKKTRSPTITQPISESNNLSRAVNILVLGVEPAIDDNITGENSDFKGDADTILLLRFDPVDRYLKLLSIPRDCQIELENGEIDRIRNLNVNNSGETTAKIISKNFDNVTIDRYLRLTSDTVIKLIDAVGGLEIFVPQTISYEDKTQKLRIDLVAGWQTLNGEKAVQFVRYLDDKGDLGRVQRQQIAVAAFQKRLKNPTIITRIPEIINILRSNVDSNLSQEESLTLANFTVDLLPDNFQMILLSGKEDSDGSWRIDSDERDSILARFLARSDAANNSDRSNSDRNLTEVKIAIQNTTTRSQVGQELLEYLSKRNFRNVRIIDDLPMDLQETQIIAQTGNINLAAKLREILNFGKINASATGDLDSEITIQIGDDFNSDR